MRSSSTDLAAGLFALLCAVAFYVQSDGLAGVGRNYSMGLVLFIFMGGLFLLSKGVRRRWSGNDPLPENIEEVSYPRVAFILAASVAYIFSIYLVGFYIASIIFLFGSAIALSNVKNSGGWGKLALAAAIFTAVMCISVWIMFVEILYVPTPEGSLFFRE
jgi:hypothetical protein